MPQKMIFLYQDNITLSPRQKSLMSILSGLLLALLEVALILKILFFHIYDIHIPASIMIGFAFLLYFIAPIPLSFYISRQTGHTMEGWKAGNITGCIGAALTTLALGAFILTTGGILPGLGYGSRGDVIFLILVIFAILNAFGTLLSLLGSAVGSGLGKIGKRNVS